MRTDGHTYKTAVSLCIREQKWCADRRTYVHTYKTAVPSCIREQNWCCCFRPGSCKRLNPHILSKQMADTCFTPSCTRGSLTVGIQHLRAIIMCVNVADVNNSMQTCNQRVLHKLSYRYREEHACLFSLAAEMPSSTVTPHCPLVIAS